MVISDSMKEMRGELHLEVYRNGRLLERDTDHNLIVTAGRAKLARLLGGGFSGRISHIGVGTNKEAANDTDTDLADKVLIPVSSVTYDGAKVRFDFKINSSTANGMNIYEFGLFFSDGTIFSRRVRTAVIGKESDIEISGYWEIYF